MMAPLQQQQQQQQQRRLRVIAVHTAAAKGTTDDDAVACALASLRRWGAVWDRLDVEGQIAEMHFPHVRLNQSHGPTHTDTTHDGFYTWGAAADFRREWRPPPPEEGFARTSQEDVTVVQAGPDKVHIAIRMSRRNAADEEYHSFPTLWIFTKEEGRWGVKFRSSFLDSNAATVSGNDTTKQ